MKKLFILFASISFLFFGACESSTEPTPEEKAKVEELSTVSQELEKTTGELHDKTSEMKDAVDDLDNLFDEKESEGEKK